MIFDDGLLDDGFLDEILARIDFVDLVRRTTDLKRSGRQFMGRCPFHEDRAPSFSVDPGRGLYHCFGCGAAGNAFQFIQATEGLSFPEAVERAAESAGMVCPEASVCTRSGRRTARRRRSNRPQAKRSIGLAVTPELQNARMWFEADQARICRWGNAEYRDVVQEIEFFENLLRSLHNVENRGLSATRLRNDVSDALGQLYDRREFLTYELAILADGEDEEMFEVVEYEGIRRKAD